MTCTSETRTLDRILPDGTAPEDTTYVQRIISGASGDGRNPDTALQNHARNLAADDAYALALIVEQARENRAYGETGRTLGKNKRLARYRKQAVPHEQYRLTCDYAFCRAHCTCDASSYTMCTCGAPDDDEPILDGVELDIALPRYRAHLHRHDDGYGDHLVRLSRVKE